MLYNFLPEVPSVLSTKQIFIDMDEAFLAEEQI